MTSAFLSCCAELAPLVQDVVDELVIRPEGGRYVGMGADGTPTALIDRRVEETVVADQQHQTESIDHQMTFAPSDFLARVIAPLVASFRTLDALTVDDARTGVWMASLDLTQMHSQMPVDLCPQSTALPLAEVVIDGAPGSKALRQITPLAGGLHEVEHCVDQFPIAVLPRASSAGRLGKAVVDEAPFSIGQIRGVSHPQRTA